MGKRYYKIMLGPWGKEYTLGSVTDQFVEYWQKQGHDLLVDYLTEVPEERMEQFSGVPEIARIGSEWHELDDLAHVYGAEIQKENFIEVEEISGFDDDAVQVNALSIYPFDPDKKNFINVMKMESDAKEYSLSGYGHPFLLNVLSVKGGVQIFKIETDGEFSVDKLTFNVCIIDNAQLIVNLNYEDQTYLEYDSNIDLKDFDAKIYG